MPVHPYDDRKVSLRRPHGNGDLANVTEALVLSNGIHFWPLDPVEETFKVSNMGT